MNDQLQSDKIGENDSASHKKHSTLTVGVVGLGSGVTGALIGYYLGKKETTVNHTYDQNDLIISPIDSDLAYRPSQFNAFKADEDSLTKPVSGNYLIHVLITCQVIRHLEFIKRDVFRDPSIKSANLLRYRSGGFKRLYNYLKYANAILNDGQAEGCIEYKTTNGLLFSSNITSISAIDVDERSAFSRYRRAFTLTDRIHDTLFSYSMTRGLFTNSVILEWCKSNGYSNGVSFNSLKEFDGDFRSLMAMSLLERNVISEIVSNGLTIKVDPILGSFDLACNITVEDLESVILTNLID